MRELVTRHADPEIRLSLANRSAWRMCDSARESVACTACVVYVPRACGSDACTAGSCIDCTEERAADSVDS